MDTSRSTILIIDDSPTVIKYLINLFKNKDFEILALKDSLELPSVLEDVVPDLILLDLYMPGMDGTDVLNFLQSKKEYSQIPVIMLTSEGDKEMLAKCMERGAFDYLNKPVNEVELNARIQTALRNKHQYDEIVKLKDQSSEQLDEMGRIQRKLLPSNFPSSEDYSIEVIYEPCDASGGDFYNVFKIGERYTAFIIADVSGHGASAMVTMAIATNYLKLLTNEIISPKQALVALNDSLFENLPTSHYLTMFYSVFDHETRTLKYASAGHPAPYVYQKKKNQVVTLDFEPGFPLKLIEAVDDFPESEVLIEQEDVLLLHTDGYSEAFNDAGEMMGTEKMGDIFMGSVAREHSVNYLFEQFNHFLGESRQQDDVALLMVKYL